MPPELARTERDRAQRLLKVARASAKLRHPRVAPVFRVSAGDRLSWYVTRPDEGETLAALVQREGPMAQGRVSALIAQVAAALSCAHEHGIVHGDLTTASVVVDPSGAASVKDFGIARACDNGTGPSMSSLLYRAPELDPAAGANGSAAVTDISTLTGMSAAADQYALGAMAWEMLTGATPFAGASADDIRNEHRSTPLPPLAALRPDLSPAVSTALERAMAKRPTDRFAGVAKFAHAFRGAVEGRVSAPVQPTPVRRTENVLMPPGSSGGYNAMPAAVPAIARKMPRPPVILGALGAGTALTLIALLVWRSNSDEPISALERQRLEVASRTFERASEAAPSDPAPVAAPSPRGADENAQTLAAPPPAASRRAPTPGKVSAKAPARSPREQRRAEAEARSSVAARGTAWITIGTNPQGAIFINDTPVPTNPVTNWPVPAGAVFLRFEVLDHETGVWTRDMVVNVAAGDTLNLRRIRLARP